LMRISKHPDTPAIVPEMTEDAAGEQSLNDENLTAIIGLLKRATGVDFSHYKTSTIRRRIIRRMLIYRLQTLDDYYKHIKENAGEVTILYQDILINVTSFFRDPDAMEYVKKTLLPKVLKAKGPSEAIRIWVPACATGEEAYSMAITLMEAVSDKDMPPVQIFATDLSDVCIAKARIGFYAPSDLANVSPARLKRFFEKIDGGYRLVKSIRDLCVFANHNVFKDPPFSRLDFISCCNLMIYLDGTLQKKLMTIFHYALTRNGYLILGKSETVSTSPQLFSQLEKKYKVFVPKKDTTTRPIFDTPFRVNDTETGKNAGIEKLLSKKDVVRTEVERTIETLLLREYIPPSVVVNLHMDILHFYGSTGFFLEPSHGKASLNLLKMARPGLTYELRNSIHKASKSGERVRKEGLQIKSKEGTHSIAIEVMPLTSNGDDPLYLVVFERSTTLLPSDERDSLSKDKMVKQLQDELTIAKEDMHSIIEEQEASMEELQSASEEIISSNEELQSINEELETSKEEVESANEELLTINAELQLRNEQLAESYEYAETVFETLGEAVLVVTKDFRVKTANKSFYTIFQVSEKETEGMLLFELGNKQWNILRLRELMEEVISDNKSFRGFEMSHTFPKIGHKTMLLNARRILQKIHRQQLIVLTIQDITELRQGEKIIREQEAWFRNMTNNVPVMIWRSGTDKGCSFVNSTWLQFTGRKLEQELGMGWTESIHPDDCEECIRIYMRSFDKRKPFKTECRLRRHDGEFRWVIKEEQPIFSAEGEFLGYIASCTEIHEKKLAHQEMEARVAQRTTELKEALEELAYTNDELSQFAYVASHDLQEPLRKIITYTDRLTDKRKVWTKDEKAHLDKIINSSERMRRLINDLLNFSKTARSNKAFKKVELAEIVNEALKDLDLKIDEKRAKINVRSSLAVEGNALQLYQLFYNLIGNALNFSIESKPPLITVTSKKLSRTKLASYTALDQKSNYVEIVVKDNGIGFKPEFAEQIFAIFQRLNTSEKYAGSGIGLALCRKIVTNHRGIIFAESTPGEGSSFHIILPVKQMYVTS
ncbi:MAG: PAS domain S-box protein, partial [Chitinophagaceae bacterium]